MEVKIKSCSDEKYWYKTEIGKTFTLDCDNTNWYVVKIGSGLGSVLKTDAEIVTDEICTHSILQEVLLNQKKDADAIAGNYVPGKEDYSQVFGPGLDHQNVVVNSHQKEKPTKITEGKLYYEIDWSFIQGVAKRMQANKSEKYERWKWKEGVDLEEINQAILRHTLEIMKGHHIDDTNYGHYYALVCNAMIAVYELKKRENKVK